MQPTPPGAGLVRGVPFPAYLRVSKKATIFVASSSVRPTFGIAVPGFTAGGLRIHFLRSSGPGLGTAPPAIFVRLAAPVGVAPTRAVAPGMAGVVGQPAHGVVAMVWAALAA